MQTLCLYKRPNSNGALLPNLPYFRVHFGQKISLIAPFGQFQKETSWQNAESVRPNSTQLCDQCSSDFSGRCEYAYDFEQPSSVEPAEADFGKLPPSIGFPCEPGKDFAAEISKYRPIAAQFHAYKRANSRRVTALLVALFIKLKRGERVRTPRSPLPRRSHIFRTQEQLSTAFGALAFEHFLQTNGSVDGDGNVILDSFTYSKKKQGWRRRGERMF